MEEMENVQAKTHRSPTYQPPPTKRNLPLNRCNIVFNEAKRSAASHPAMQWTYVVLFLPFLAYPC